MLHFCIKIRGTFLLFICTSIPYRRYIIIYYRNRIILPIHTIITLEVIMKKLLTAVGITGSVLLFPVFSDSPFFKVNGQIKNYTKTDYTITQKFGDYFRTPDTKYVHNLNADGRETDISQFNASGSLINKITYVYDDKGKTVSQTGTDASNITEWKVLYTYDDKGIKTEESEYGKDNTLSGKSIFKYPDTSQCEESYYNGQGALIWKNISRFDEKGRKTEAYQYFADGSLDEKQAFIYNENGILVEIDNYDANGRQIRRVKYRFGSDGTITETQTDDMKNNAETREFYKYDDSGNLSKVTTYTVAHKFGTIVNELTDMSEYTYTK